MPIPAIVAGAAAVAGRLAAKKVAQGAVKKAASKAAAKPAKSSMTATVVKKVSPNVKVIKAGSRPLTQTATEKAAMVAKAKTKTPAVRAKAKADKKSLQKDITQQRNYEAREAGREALKRSGFDANLTKFGNKPSAAQTKAVNKAQAESNRLFKARLDKAKADAKAKRGKSK